MSDDDIAEIRARHEQVPSGNLSIEAISLAHDDRATLLAEVDRLRAEVERLRDVLRSVCVHPSGDRMVKITFVKEDCTFTFPVVPSTTWALEVLIEFDQARREALDGKP